MESSNPVERASIGSQIRQQHMGTLFTCTVGEGKKNTRTPFEELLATTTQEQKYTHVSSGR